MPTVLRLVARARRRVLIHRRGLAALCLAALVWVVLGAAHPTPPATTTLWTAAHDLPSGARLAAPDLVEERFLAGTAPRGAVRDHRVLLGRTLVAPLTRGEAITTTDVLGHERLHGYPGLAAIGLRIPDETVAGLLRAGDRVDLVATDPQQSHAPELLVHDAVVLMVPPSSSGAAAGAGTGRLVVFAVPATDVTHVADLGAARYLDVVWTS